MDDELSLWQLPGEVPLDGSNSGDVDAVCEAIGNRLTGLMRGRKPGARMLIEAHEDLRREVVAMYSLSAWATYTDRMATRRVKPGGRAWKRSRAKSDAVLADADRLIEATREDRRREIMATFGPSAWAYNLTEARNASEVSLT